MVENVIYGLLTLIIDGGFIAAVIYGLKHME